MREDAGRRWTWGDSLFALLPVVGVALAAMEIAELPSRDRAGAWRGFLTAAAAAAAVGGALVFAFLRRGGSAREGAASEANRRVNVGIGWIFVVVGVAVAQMTEGSVKATILGGATGALVVAMGGYWTDARRNRR